MRPSRPCNMLRSRRLLFFLCGVMAFVMLSLTAPVPASAQIYENVYRPSQQRYVLSTPHFRIIYPEGNRETALRTARVLEDQYPIIRDLVGGSLRRFPVVLNDHNDRSNGYVTPLHFRTEIEIPPIKGLALNPRTGGWIENVAPHELVHALHFSNIPRNSIPALLYPFSPDLTRSIHGAAPFGMIEGIAVFHESKVVYGAGGRGNYSLFRNQAHSNFAGDSPWSLGQLMMPSGFSMPFNRHYTGGYEFIRWMQYRHGMDTTRSSIEFFVRLPFLGYGTALYYATGSWPGSLYREFRNEMREFLETEHPSSRDTDFTDGTPVSFSAAEVTHYRPLWLDNERLLFSQTTQYNSRPGLYIYNTGSGHTRLLHETRLTGDFLYDFDPDRNRLLFSRYHRHPWHVNAWKMDISELDLETGRASRITKKERVHSPSYAGVQGDGFRGAIALQTYSETSRLVQIDEGGRAEPLVSLYPNTVVQVGASPAKEGTYAIIANRNGIQALWIIRDENFDALNSANPQIAFRGGIVHDFSWSADGEHLLLSGTLGDVSQIFKFDPEGETLIQLTRTRFGATQPSLSPDAQSLAYIEQIGNSRRTVILEKSGFLNQPLQPVDFQPDLSRAFESGRLSDYREEDKENWETKPYHTGISWLWPRLFAPLILDDQSPVLDTRIGAVAEGGDVLRRHAWRAELSWANERLWGELLYRNSTFWPGYQTELYYRPLTTARGLFINRGAILSLPFSYSFDSRSRSSYLLFRPGVRAREIRAHQLSPVNGQTPEVNRDWLTDISVRASLTLALGLQQNIRDIHPNTGTIFFTQAEQFVYSDREAEVAGIRGGIIQYLTPLMRYNHNLTLRAEALTQTRTRLYSTSGLVYDGFSGNILAGLRNAGNLHARYSLPLRYVDDGLITVPFFLDRIYLSLNANYVADLNRIDSDNFSTVGRAVYGAELRANVRFFNLPLDLGIGVGFEPTRSEWTVFGGAR